MKKRFLILALFVLLAAGLVVLYSATQTSSLFASKQNFFYRQLIWTGIGLTAFFVAFSVPPRVISFFTPFLYLFILLALVTVLILPPSVTATHRWLSLGFFRFQPSELAKLGVILMLAHYFAHRDRHLDSLKEGLIPAAIALIPVGLILIEPDLGTSLTFIPIILAMLYWAGLRGMHIFLIMAPLGGLVAIYSHWVWLLYLVLIALVLFRSKADLIDNSIVFGLTIAAGIVAPFLWGGLKEYQKQRIFTFFNPEKDPLGAGYQIIQSRVAIGSGGLTGKGFLEGSQKNLSFLPEQHTDFIFSVVGEEFGLLGVLGLLMLYGWILMGFISIAQKTQNRFVSYMTIGITAMLLTQIVVNIGMTLGILPVVGLPLPLVSYGGSSLVTTLFAIGLIFSGQRRENQFF